MDATDLIAQLYGILCLSIGIGIYADPARYKKMIAEFTASSRKGIEEFKNVLLKADIDVTERKTMGQDIAAACGQLALTIKSDGKTVG